MDTKIKQIEHEFFLKVCIPNISEESMFIMYASNLPYRVYQIRKNNNFNENIHHMTCNFSVMQINSNRDIYELYVKKGQRLYKYDSAFVNDYKTSVFLKSVFNNKSKKYQEIEYSDDENDDNEEEIYMETKHVILTCVYVNNVKKWKPYFKTKHQIDSYSKIKEIEKKYNAYVKT